MDRRRSPARSSIGALALILLQGVCVWGETVNAVVGGSVVLPSGYLEKDVSSAEWQFGKNSSNLKPIAEFVQNVLYEYDPFKGRLEIDPYNFSLTVTKLTKEDSGVFLFTGRKSGRQIRSKIVQLQVYDSTLKEVNIKKTLHQPNTCTFNFLCDASGPPDVTFSWSGYRTGNGASLHLSLSPADGSVMLKCTAASGESSLEKSVIVSCDCKTFNNSGNPDISPAPSTDCACPNQLGVGIVLGIVISFVVILLVTALHHYMKRKVQCLKPSDSGEQQQQHDNVGQSQRQLNGGEEDQSPYMPLQSVNQDVYETISAQC